MVPERLEFLGRFDKFYKMLIEQLKTEGISESEFYMLIGVKVKSMGRERQERNRPKV